MRTHHPGYIDAPAFDMIRSAIFRALPEAMMIVDVSAGPSHSDVVTVSTDESLELAPARANNWGPGPAIARDLASEHSDPPRAD